MPVLVSWDDLTSWQACCFHPRRWPPPLMWSRWCGQVPKIGSMADLTGYWLADDGCQYYLSQEGNQLCWAGLDNQGSFHDGLQVSNVFFGELILEPPFVGAPVTESITGQWFDVPRGPSMSSGSLTLTMEVDSSGEVVALNRQSASGRFRAAQWRRSPRETDLHDDRFWFDKPTYGYDATGLFVSAVKNSGNPLENDLTPYRNVVVAYGWLRYDDPAKGFRRPYVSQLVDWGKRISDFFNTNHDGDRDANFDLSLDVVAFHNHLALSDISWLPGRDPDVIENKLIWKREHEGQGESSIHCEMVMYGVSTDHQPIVPGWAQLDGNSILINGKPFNGNIGIGAPIKDLFPLSSVFLPGPVYFDDPVERELISIGGINLPPNGSYIRVTGVLVLDCGHADFDSNGVYDLRPCFDEADDDFDLGKQNQEIHPVYAVDLINSTPSADLSGTWGADNGDTIYLHQVGQTVMGLRLPPLNSGNRVTVLRAFRRGDELRGTWRQLSPPISGGELLLQGGGPSMIATAPTTDANWVKLYDAVDQTPAIEITETNYPTCDVRRPLQDRAGGTASFKVTTSNFPTGSKFTYLWTSPGVELAADEDFVVLSRLPVAGTIVPVSVVVRDDTGSEYTASHDLLVRSSLPGDDRSWISLICLLQKLGKIPVPTPIPIPNIPDPPPFEVIQQIREIRAPTLTEIDQQLHAAVDLVRELSGEPRSSEGGPRMQTAFSITSVNFNAELVEDGGTRLNVDFEVHDTGPSHVAGLVVTTDFWRTSQVVPAAYQRTIDGFEVWHADFLADTSVTFEFVIFCDDYGGDKEVPRIWDTNGGRRYQASI